MIPAIKTGNSSEDEDVDVETPMSTSQKRKNPSHQSKRRKVDDKKIVRHVDSPSNSGGSKQSLSPISTTYRAGYKMPEEMELNSNHAAVTSVQKYVEKLSQGLCLSTSPQTPKTAGAKRKRGNIKKDTDSSGEEERWLDAIQSGKLEEVDEELKKVKPKDPKLMTARQRAMLERKSDKDPTEKDQDKDHVEQLMALPSGYKEVVMTAEAIERKALKSQKRKEKADEKREKDKIKTMERLLKKQESKALRTHPKRSSRKDCSFITYISTVDGARVLFPGDVPYTWVSKSAVGISPLPPKLTCGFGDCENLRKYDCRKTGIPLCSLECYKKRLELKGQPYEDDFSEFDLLEDY